ncbi:hypothetical protein [Priestia endophytica]|uniref:hypothetical protein n=1 Tax=Priestia endophytica TaxID=135735 RepID=UPI0011135375|nr:hypothetical protein [Priestia endophytica]
MLTNKPGIELAKEIVRVEKKKEELIKQSKLNFKVYTKRKKGIVVRSVCCVCECEVETEKYNSLEIAQYKAASLTLGGKRVNEFDVCERCLSEC